MEGWGKVNEQGEDKIMKLMREQKERQKAAQQRREELAREYGEDLPQEKPEMQNSKDTEGGFQFLSPEFLGISGIFLFLLCMYMWSAHKQAKAKMSNARKRNKAFFKKSKSSKTSKQP